LDKKDFGKGAGIGGVIAVIISIICSLTHDGVLP